MNALAYAWIVRRRILTAGRGVPWILLTLASLAIALSFDEPDAHRSFFPRAASHLLVGLVGATGVAAFGPCAFLAFKGTHSLDSAVASRPIGRFARAAGAAGGAGVAAAAILAAFALVLIPFLSIDGDIRERLSTLDVTPSIMRKPGDTVRFSNPLDSEIQLFPEVGFARSYGGGDPAVVKFAGDPVTNLGGEFELGTGEAPRISAGGKAGRDWAATHIRGTLPVYWPEGSVAAIGGVMGTRRTLAYLFLQAVPFLFFVAGVGAALSTLLESPVAGIASGVIAFLALTSVLPKPVSSLNLTHYVDAGWLLRGILVPVNGAEAALALLTVSAALVAAPVLRRRVR